eukprot:CAMPEP_0194068484 /NCGR_PEP_ID=MMETSP0009_2-20130614/87123_1 /TAXON_ID=210454 /ORGANISM="Grammatophora oceanica, Strain CCMP 410" /LENGTH=185 /DNA_ID=CAMNT_0038721589 /DNA_START=731 /DNA_END=1288 /DNA_ORIENTATION=-
MLLARQADIVKRFRASSKRTWKMHEVRSIRDCFVLAKHKDFSLQDNDGIALVLSKLEACQTIQCKLKMSLEDAMKYDPSMIDLEEVFHLNVFVLEAPFVELGIDTARKTIEEKVGSSKLAPAATRRRDAGSHGPCRARNLVIVRVKLHDRHKKYNRGNVVLLSGRFAKIMDELKDRGCVGHDSSP